MLFLKHGNIPECQSIACWVTESQANISFDIDVSAACWSSTLMLCCASKWGEERELHIRIQEIGTDSHDFIFFTYINE